MNDAQLFNHHLRNRLLPPSERQDAPRDMARVRVRCWFRPGLPPPKPNDQLGPRRWYDVATIEGAPANVRVGDKSYTNSFDGAPFEAELYEDELRTLIAVKVMTDADVEVLEYCRKLQVKKVRQVMAEEWGQGLKVADLPEDPSEWREDVLRALQGYGLSTVVSLFHEQGDRKNGLPPLARIEEIERTAPTARATATTASAPMAIDPHTFAMAVREAAKAIIEEERRAKKAST